MSRPSTLGELKKTGYTPKSIKEELRQNLITKLQKKEKIFEGVLGFDDTVIPDIQRAILSRHNVLLLGLRGQAKTRIARLMTSLLDEYTPIIEGSELNDDPMRPLSRYGIDKVKEQGDDTPIAWLHRDSRYVEKLATPDVSVADLIGDVDPIKAATLKLPYSDERVLHFGLVPRSHRSIFVINELPDLQPRIQVSLFNILQEGDIQIRGFKLRLPLDISFVFTANPEDYTNRGSIITPLKDRIESQILTHYPRTLEVARSIMLQEAKLSSSQKESIYVPKVLQNIITQLAFAARDSEYIDEKSGVSARLTIAAYENLVSTAERRMLLNGEKNTVARVSDFWGVIPAITGKVELVYEGEQEGAYGVALKLLGAAFLAESENYFPEAEGSDQRVYGVLKAFFGDNNQIELLNDASNNDYKDTLDKVPGLKKIAKKYTDSSEDELYTMMELLLFSLSEQNFISRGFMNTAFSFGDMLAGLWDEYDDDNFE